MESGCVDCRYWQGPSDEEWGMLAIDTPTESVSRPCALSGHNMAAYDSCLQWEVQEEGQYA